MSRDPSALDSGGSPPVFLIQWHEKATAPLNGEHILVTQLGGRGFGICGDRWQDWCAVVHYWPVAGEEGFYLSTGASDPHDDRPMEFTHWAPLPDATTVATFPGKAHVR